MATIEIILAVISSSILSAILSSIVNWRLHNSNYKKEYYKKILDKRLEAYEIVHNIAARLSFQTQLDDCVIPSICFNQSFYDDFIFLIGKGISTAFWLDRKTSSKLTELNVFLLNNISNQIPEIENEELLAEKYQKMGSIYHEKIRQFRKDLQELSNLELKNLYKVDSFFNHKIREKDKTFLVYK